MKISNSRLSEISGLTVKSIWLFPTILLIIVVMLTALKIHGSSIGIYYQELYGYNSTDPDLLYGEPRPIRSDEWLLATPSTIHQAKTGFQAYSDKLKISGDDITKSSEQPTRDWVTIFRPHTWAYFVLPLDHAFAFRWWIVLYGLIVSCYFFILSVLKKKNLAILLSLSFGLTPYFLWWYQSHVFMIFTIGFLLLILTRKILDHDKSTLRNTKALHTFFVLSLSYLGTTLFFTIYPPHAIPVFFIVATYVLGLISQRYFIEKDIPIKALLQRIGLMFIAVLISAVTILIYTQQHREMISAVSNTAYPGERKTSGGEMALYTSVDGFLVYRLQENSAGENYYHNQSEVSNFIIPLVGMLPVGFYFAFISTTKGRKKSKRYIDAPLLLLASLGVFYLARVHVPLIANLNIPIFDRVPNVRLIASAGYLAFLILIFAIKKLQKHKLTNRYRIGAFVHGIAFYLLLLLSGKYILGNFPKFSPPIIEVALLAAVPVLIVAGFLYKKNLLAALLFLTFSFYSSYRILPIYRDIDFFQSGPLVQHIENISNKDDDWIVVDDLTYLNIPLAAGANQISGSQSYPDIEYWNRLGYGDYEEVFNRQARMIFITTDPTMDKLELESPNFFKIKFECTQELINEAEYILAVYPIERECVKLKDTLYFPNRTFYIYEM